MREMRGMKAKVLDLRATDETRINTDTDDKEFELFSSEFVLIRVNPRFIRG
jgi:hypothetical protein